MIKRLSLFLSLLIIFTVARAGQDINVTLQRGVVKDTTEVIHYLGAVLEFRLIDNQVIISMKNDSDEYFLFSKEQLNNKQLNEFKLEKKVSFKKHFGGKKKNPTIEATTNLLYKTLAIPPRSEFKSIIVINLDNKDSLPRQIKINLYRADKKKKIEITELFEITCNINVEDWDPETDATYQGLKKKVDEFVDRVKSTTFCTNHGHKSEQKEVLEKKRTQLIDTINKTIHDQDLYPKDPQSSHYDQLIHRLKEVDLDKVPTNTCPTHAPAPKKKTHSCNNCKLSEEQIFKALDSIYISRNYNATNKQRAKSLYNCYIGNTKRTNKQLAGKIQDLYNKITQ